MFKICEIFKSLQGEGRFAGRPANFIRFYGCNLNCERCDEREKMSGFRVMGTQEILMSLSKDTRYVILTGGEPLLQTGIDKLIAELGAYSYRVCLETNGTFYTPLYFYACVSPKPGTKVDDRWFKSRDVDFKFVVTLDETEPPAWNIEDALDYIYRHNLRKSRVFLMPLYEGGKLKYCGDIWDVCIEHGLNYSDRLHIRVGRR